MENFTQDNIVAGSQKYLLLFVVKWIFIAEIIWRIEYFVVTLLSYLRLLEKVKYEILDTILLG